MNKIPPLNLRLDTEGDSCIIIRLSFANPEARTDHADAHTLSGSPDPVNAELNRRAIYLAHRIQDAIGQALPKAIIEANTLKNPDRLEAGATINIPAAAEKKAPPAGHKRR